MAHDESTPGSLPRRTASQWARPEFPPASTYVQATFGAKSRRGQHRAINEDHYCVIELGRHQETLLTSLTAGEIEPRFEEFGHAILVADGAGPYGSGETVSRLAISTLNHLMLQFGKWNLRIDDQVAQEIMQRAERFYRQLNTAIEEGNRNAGPRAQTTLTAIFGSGRDLFFAHVGHSRAYLYRDHLLMRLTRDHTVTSGARPMTMAPLVDVSASAVDLTHIITNSLGAFGTGTPLIDIERFRILDGDRVLVCSNGLTDAIHGDFIATVMSSSLTAEEQAGRLIAAAEEADARDDATAVVAHYAIPGAR
jgi:serine/threonine protein phosphatase PrpC